MKTSNGEQTGMGKISMLFLAVSLSMRRSVAAQTDTGRQLGAAAQLASQGQFEDAKKLAMSVLPIVFTVRRGESNTRNISERGKDRT